MIPKKIHFVWLGKGKYTPSVRRCIDSWKRCMPDFEIKCWNEDNFDLDSVTWVKEAISKKKWSLASDYIRHYAIYTEGGIYMDTDVLTFKSFTPFLKYDFFTAVEHHPKIYTAENQNKIKSDGMPERSDESVKGFALLAACFGASKGNPYIKECMDFFGERNYIREDGSLFEDIINPDIMAMLLTKRGFRYRDENQMLDNNFAVFNSSVFASEDTRNKDSFAVHWFYSSWTTDLQSWKGRLAAYARTHFFYLFRH